MREDGRSWNHGKEKLMLKLELRNGDTLESVGSSVLAKEYERGRISKFENFQQGPFWQSRRGDS